MQKAELRALRAFLDRLPIEWDRLETRPGYVPKVPETTFFGQRPHLLMLLGFDEFRVVRRSEDAAEDILRPYDMTAFSGTIEYESLFRLRSSGVWKWFEGVATPYLSRVWGGPNQVALHFKEEDGAGQLLIPVARLLKAVEKAVIQPPAEPHSLVFPGLWLPSAQRLQHRLLADRIGQLLRQIHDGESSLQLLTPQQMEDLVASLLQGQGMQIHVTPYSHDGGRDIIARGELVPGEPTTLAVEVKKKAVVGIADVQRAIYANRFFSSLLIATSGRFSAGVVREKSRPEHELRLILKDGVALRQWIRLHGIRHGWPGKRPTRK